MERRKGRRAAPASLATTPGRRKRVKSPSGLPLAPHVPSGKQGPGRGRAQAPAGSPTSRRRGGAAAAAAAAKQHEREERKNQERAAEVLLELFLDGRARARGGVRSPPPRPSVLSPPFVPPEAEPVWAQTGLVCPEGQPEHRSAFERVTPPRRRMPLGSDRPRNSIPRPQNLTQDEARRQVLQGIASLLSVAGAGAAVGVTPEFRDKLQAWEKMLRADLHVGVARRAAGARRRRAAGGGSAATSPRDAKMSQKREDLRAHMIKAAGRDMDEAVASANQTTVPPQFVNAVLAWAHALDVARA